MIGILVSGHGHFASGITSSLELIMGKQDDYLVVDFPNGDTAAELERNMKCALSKFADKNNVIIFTDLLSGSPFNTAIIEAMKDSRIKVIYGTNLGMLIESVLKRNMGESFENIVNDAIEIGRTQIGIFEPKVNDDLDEFDE